MSKNIELSTSEASKALWFAPPEPIEYKKVALVALLFFISAVVTLRVLYGMGLHRYCPIPLSVGALSLMVGAVAFFASKQHPLSKWMQAPFEQPVYIDEGEALGVTDFSIFSSVTDKTPIVAILTKGDLLPPQTLRLFKKLDGNKPDTSPGYASKCLENGSVTFDFSVGKLFRELNLLKENQIIYLRKALWNKFVTSDGTLTKDGKTLVATGKRPIYNVGFYNHLQEYPSLFCSINGETNSDGSAIWYNGENVFGRLLEEIRTILQNQDTK